MFKSLVKKLSGVSNRWTKSLRDVFKKRLIDDEFWEQLEEVFIQGDVGIDLSVQLIEKLKEEAEKNSVSDTQQLKELFCKIMVDELSVPKTGEEIELITSPTVVLMVGVNGSGKTTTIAKLAKRFKDRGKIVVAAASDTFRAAAVSQLKLWGERIGFRVIAHGEGADPAAVAFDAVNAALKSKADLVFIDTAGRLHTKFNLMEELKKISRVISKLMPSQPHERLLVVDSITGQNGFKQAKAFNEALSLTGVILTKYDSSAKGGFVFSITKNLGLPIRYIGVGESEDDIMLFDPESFILGILGEVFDE